MSNLVRKALGVFMSLGVVAFYGCDWNTQPSEPESSIVVSSRIGIETGAGDQKEPRAAFDSINRRFLVVHAEEGATIFHDLRGQLVNADGSLFGQSIPISVGGGDPDSQTIGESRGSLVAFDPSSQRFLVVWPSYREETVTINDQLLKNRGNKIYGQFVNSDGSLPGGSFCISPILVCENVDPTLPLWASCQGHEAQQPVVAFDTTSHRFLVAWRGVGVHHYPGSSSVYGQFVDSNDSLSGSVTQISDLRADYAAISPRIAFDSTKERFLVTWGEQVKYSVNGRLVNSDGSFNGEEFRIKSDCSGCSYVGSLASDSNHGRFLQTFESDNNILGQLVDSSGSLYGSEFSVFPSSFVMSGGHSVAYDAVHEKFIVTADGGEEELPHLPGPRISGQYVNSNGGRYKSAFEILSIYEDASREGSNPGFFQPYVVFGYGAIGSLVVYSDFVHPVESGFDIFGKFVKLSP